MIYLNQSYFEKIRLKNVMGLYAHYDLTISPNDSSKILISTDDRTVQSWLVTTNGKISTFFEDLNKYEIGVGGMNFELINNKLHAIDSRPICYEISLIESIRKALNSNASNKIAKTPHIASNRYSITEFSKLQSREYADYERLRINLKGLRNNENILLKCSNNIQISKSSISTLIRPKCDMYYSTSRHISLLFKNGQFAESLKVKFYEIVKLLEVEFVKENKDLGELEIFIEYSDQEKFENDPEFIFDWEWSLRNLFSNKDKLKEE